MAWKPLATISGIVAQDTLRIILGMPWRDEVKKLMRAQGVTQEELVTLLGVKTRGAVGHYLSGRRNMKPEQFYTLLKRLGVEARDVFEPSTATDTFRVAQAIESLPPVERRHLQAVVDSFAQSARWDKVTERRMARKEGKG